MAHIAVKEGVPGIRSLFQFRPETGGPLCELAEALLRGPSPLSSAERELIAAYVSHRNECIFCRNSHAAAARCLFGDDNRIVDELLHEHKDLLLSKKMKALLALAGKVQQGGISVHAADIKSARDAGAGDTDIHDTVLIAASFSMFNRYVDGLNVLTPTEESDYLDMGKRMSEKGYQL
ncbi:MAG TPA: peroxidase-related enzyme [Puia sp.]